MVVFHSYVKLPEGILGRDPLRKSVFSALLEIEIVFERSWKIVSPLSGNPRLLLGHDRTALGKPCPPADCLSFSRSRASWGRCFKWRPGPSLVTASNLKSKKEIWVNVWVHMFCHKWGCIYIYILYIYINNVYIHLHTVCTYRFITSYNPMVLYRVAQTVHCVRRMPWWAQMNTSPTHGNWAWLRT